jgi:hypothetical protein
LPEFGNRPAIRLTGSGNGDDPAKPKFGRYSPDRPPPVSSITTGMGPVFADLILMLDLSISALVGLAGGFGR